MGLKFKENNHQVVSEFNSDTRAGSDIALCALPGEQFKQRL